MPHKKRVSRIDLSLFRLDVAHSSQLDRFRTRVADSTEDCRMDVATYLCIPFIYTRSPDDYSPSHLV